MLALVGRNYERFDHRVHLGFLFRGKNEEEDAEIADDVGQVRLVQQPQNVGDIAFFIARASLSEGFHLFQLGLDRLYDHPFLH